MFAKNLKALDALSQHFDYKKDLGTAMIWHKVFGAVKLIGKSLLFFGPPGMIAGTILSVRRNIYYKKLQKVLDEYVNNNIPFVNMVKKIE